MTKLIRQINSNLENFKKLTCSIKIKEGVFDITNGFHPTSNKYPGVYGMSNYLDEIDKNNNSFNRKAEITKELKNGGMIVLSSDINNEDVENKEIGTEYQRTFGQSYITSTIENYLNEKHLREVGFTIGKDFSGRYVTKNAKFDENSFTIDLANIDSNVLVDIASDLAHNFCQTEVLVKDFNKNRTYFVNGKR